MNPPAGRKAAGTRPSAPVRQDDPPSDYLCTWAYRVAVWSNGPARGCWELKYINAACPDHSHLATAA